MNELLTPIRTPKTWSIPKATVSRWLTTPNNWLDRGALQQPRCPVPPAIADVFVGGNQFWFPSLAGPGVRWRRMFTSSSAAPRATGPPPNGGRKATYHDRRL